MAARGAARQVVDPAISVADLSPAVEEANDPTPIFCKEHLVCVFTFLLLHSRCVCPVQQIFYGVVFQNFGCASLFYWIFQALRNAPQHKSLQIISKSVRSMGLVRRAVAKVYYMCLYRKVNVMVLIKSV